VAKLFELILTWLSIIPNYRDSMKELKVNHLYAVDLATAIASCGPELSKMLGQCFGMCRRANEFSAKYGHCFMTDGTCSNKKYSREKGFMMSIVNVFGNMGGFDKFITLLSKGVDTELGTCDPASIIPLPLISGFLEQLKQVKVLCNEDMTQGFAIQASMLLKVRIENLNDIELKELDKDVPLLIIRLMTSFMGLY